MIEKTNGEKYLYAWLDRHHDVSLVEKGTIIEKSEISDGLIERCRG